MERYKVTFTHDYHIFFAVTAKFRECRRSLWVFSFFTDDQFSVISWAAVTMNAFNRVSIVSGHPVRADKPAR